MFNVRKAVALTAKFLELAGGQLNDIKLTKMQYVVERMSILENWTQLTADKYASIPWGPVLSEACYLSTDKRADEYWDQFIGFKPYVEDENSNTVLLLEIPEPHNILNATEISLVDQVWTIFKDLSKYQAHDWCVANCPEYMAVRVGATPRQRVDIHVSDIFRAAGYSHEESIRCAEELRHQELLDDTFGVRDSSYNAAVRRESFSGSVGWGA